jgi:positive regulator of sigma E activity
MLVWILFALVLIINAIFGKMLPHGVELFVYIGACIAMLGYVIFKFYKRKQHGNDPLQELNEVYRVMSEEEKILDKSDRGD